MRFLTIIFLLAPITLFAQDKDLIPKNCWEEYKHENLPYPESEHCPLIICPDNSTICFMKEENELFRFIDGWKKISENQLQIEDSWKFNIIQETDTELHLQSVEYPNFKIYLRR